MRAVQPMYATKFAEGTATERAMNDMDAEGYEVQQVVYCGSKPQPNRIDPNQIMLIPLFMVIGQRRGAPLTPIQDDA